MAWDTGGWKLNAENPDIQFIAPKSGALGWIDTFAIPAKGRDDDAAYKWINFNMRPEIAAKVAASAGNFTASKGADKLTQAKLKAQFAKSFPQAAIDNIKWYPAVPAGIEEIEGKVLDQREGRHADADATDSIAPMPARGWRAVVIHRPRCHAARPRTRSASPSASAITSPSTT